MPRWYYKAFPDVFNSFQKVMKEVPSTISVLPHFPCEFDMFELDGRTLKGAYALQYLGALINAAEDILQRQDMDNDVRLVAVDSKYEMLHGQVSIVTSEVAKLRQDLQVEVAKHKEENDGRINER